MKVGSLKLTRPQKAYPELVDEQWLLWIYIPSSIRLLQVLGVSDLRAVLLKGVHGALSEVDVIHAVMPVIVPGQH